MRPLFVMLCVGASAMAFTTAATAQPRQASAFSQPLRDLGVVRDQVPEILASAVASPYATPLTDGRADCRAVIAELAALDDALGPDLNLQIRRDRTVGNFVNGAIRDALDIPYSGVVRRLTGAERRDREMASAIQAGTVRRAFLKGVRDSACTAPMQPIEHQQLASVEIAPNMPVFAEPETLNASDVPAEPARPVETNIALTPVSATATSAQAFAER